MQSMAKLIQHLSKSNSWSEAHDHSPDLDSPSTRGSRVGEVSFFSYQVYSDESTEISSTGSEEEEEQRRSHRSQTRRHKTSQRRCSRKHHDTSSSN
uniref:Uncharacterized protein n=1 Tax=Sphaerodactylus townsendi TaxID=933632 RepID=A0ACB8GAP8_9SAUR